MDRIDMHAFYRVWSDDVGVFVTGWREGKRFVGKSVEFGTQSKEGEFEPEPTFRMSLEAAQVLMGRLWDAGIRPAQAKQGDGQTKHLEDMRAIAFAKLNVTKP